MKRTIHELRNRLAALLGYIELDEPEKAKEQVRQIASLLRKLHPKCEECRRVDILLNEIEKAGGAFRKEENTKTKVV